MRKRVLLAYKERKMKLKVCVTKIHSVEVLRNGVIAMNCDLIEDKPSTDRIIFLNKKMYEMVIIIFHTLFNQKNK